MSTDMSLHFAALREEDIPALTHIMKRAFDEDTRIHLGEPTGGPPGYDNGDFLRRYAIEDTTTTALKIIQNSCVIGAVIMWINEKTNENYLGNLFLDPENENKGIGKAVWEMVEQRYPNTRIWRTDTPIFSHRNHHFYVNKCGFHIIRIENPKDLREGSYILEKRFPTSL